MMPCGSSGMISILASVVRAHETLLDNASVTLDIAAFLRNCLRLMLISFSPRGFGDNSSRQFSRFKIKERPAHRRNLEAGRSMNRIEVWNNEANRRPLQNVAIQPPSTKTTCRVINSAAEFARRTMDHPIPHIKSDSLSILQAPLQRQTRSDSRPRNKNRHAAHVKRAH